MYCMLTKFSHAATPILPLHGLLYHLWSNSENVNIKQLSDDINIWVFQTPVWSWNYMSLVRPLLSQSPPVKSHTIYLQMMSYFQWCGSILSIMQPYINHMHNYEYQCTYPVNFRGCWCLTHYKILYIAQVLTMNDVTLHHLNYSFLMCWSISCSLQTICYWLLCL